MISVLVEDESETSFSDMEKAFDFFWALMIASNSDKKQRIILERDGVIVYDFPG